LQPTVTDALVMLGILSTDEGFAGGSFRLSRKGVDEAFQAIGDAMGYGAEEAAFDCWRVVNANMTTGVRRTTAGKGLDPKDLVMLAYGGNGPAFAGIQAEDLGIRKVLVPRTSPTFSALGTLVADPAIDEQRSYICSADAIDTARLKDLWGALEERAERFFADANVPANSLTARYQLNTRYPGQNWPVTFDIAVKQGLHDLSFVDGGLTERAIGLFNEHHLAEFGHVREGEMPEVTGVRLVTTVKSASVTVGSGFSAARRQPPPVKHRRANLGRGFEETRVFLGPELRPGNEIIGPAIIDEVFTTIVVYPGWTAIIDDAGDYELNQLD
jgi:N-methylhydantoinase A